VKREHRYYVYILASASRVLYVGMTSELRNRVWQHRNKRFEGFSAKYNCYRLVYYEEFQNVQSAIGRERQLKRWSRAKKVTLIESINRDWNDMAEEWFLDDPVLKYH
jgi:putative endonuclease